MAKILCFDIETSPVIAYVWQGSVHKAYIDNEKIIEDMRVLSFGAKWLGEEGITYKDIRGQINDKGEKWLLLQLRDLIERADVVVAHNGVAFDVPTILAKFAAYDIPPPRPPQFFDTCLIARKHFKFTSNKLEYLARILGCSLQKHTHGKFPGISLWRECLKDNKQAWDEMRVYNKIDVQVLEWVYLKLRPYAIQHPNIANINGTSGCPKCGRQFLIKAGFSYKDSRTYQRYRCPKCGAWTESKTALRSADNKVIAWTPQ